MHHCRRGFLREWTGEQCIQAYYLGFGLCQALGQPGALVVQIHQVSQRKIDLYCSNHKHHIAFRFLHQAFYNLYCRRLKLRYVERPTHITYSSYAVSKGQSLWNSLNILIDLLLRKVFR